jgi:teichuronic acid biosynthesis glycosyltransferase TuaG
MNKKENVDIILPVYNSQDYIYQTIKSIFKQSYKHWRLIIVNDCSTDNTRNILNQIFSESVHKKKILIFNNKKNLGQAYSRNRALKNIKAKYVAFIDSDDLWKENKLRDQISFMKKNNYEFTYTNYFIFNKNIRKLILVPSFFSYNKFVYNTSIATSTIIVTKKLIGNIKFNIFRLCEDYAFKCQLLKKVKYARRLNKANSFYRVRTNSLQSNRLKVFFYVWSINKKINKMNFFKNFTSLLFISLSSIKKYGLR